MFITRKRSGATCSPKKDIGSLMCVSEKPLLFSGETQGPWISIVFVSQHMLQTVALPLLCSWDTARLSYVPLPPACSAGASSTPGEKVQPQSWTNPMAVVGPCGRGPRALTETLAQVSFPSSSPKKDSHYFCLPDLYSFNH